MLSFGNRPNIFGQDCRLYFDDGRLIITYCSLIVFHPSFLEGHQTDTMLMDWWEYTDNTKLTYILTFLITGIILCHGFIQPASYHFTCKQTLCSKTYRVIVSFLHCNTFYEKRIECWSTQVCF